MTEASVRSLGARGAAVAFQGSRALASLVFLIAHKGRGQSWFPPPLTAAWQPVGEEHA